MVEDSAHGGTYRPPLDGYGSPSNFLQSNIFLALASALALALSFLQHASAEQEFFLAAAIFFSLAAAVVGEFLKRKVDNAMNATSVPKLIEEATIIRVDYTSGTSLADFMINSPHAILLTCMYASLALGAMHPILKPHYLPSLAILASVEVAYLSSHFELYKKAEELKAIADDLSQKLAERPDARLKRACADRARELYPVLDLNRSEPSKEIERLSEPEERIT
ncbi:MAG TPA: hypothetical protein VGZ92_01495 [Bradyrhizobium sp.]|nr:hypothetical protein [Bradyrhizobium sp.]